MAVVMAQSARPSLWESFRQEIFKGRKQLFYRLVLGMPIAIPIVIMVIQVFVKIFSRVETGVPDSSPFSSFTDFGLQGTFAISNRLMFLQFGGVYGAIVVIACALSVANEYRWNTIKMLATRQPSRIKLVLSKCLFAVSMVVGAGIATIIGWFIWGMFLKFFYDVPFDITPDDIENMGKGLRYFGVICLQTLLFSLFAIALTFLFKSVVGGIVAYLIYSGLDAFVSVIGAQFANSGIKTLPEWALPFLRSAQMMNPYLVSSSVNRLTQQEKYVVLGRSLTNNQIIASNPIGLAWLVLVIYCLIFTVLAVLFFTLRDIRD